MKRHLIIVVIAAGLALGAIAPALARPSAKGTTVKLRRTHIGSILVTSSGFTLYGFGPDRKNKDNCAPVRECLVLWPALTTKGKPVAGPGVNSRLLGTIRLGRSLQITYAGHPLYTYIQDRGPGDVSHVNIPQFGGLWPALNAAGHLLDKAGHVVK